MKTLIYAASFILGVFFLASPLTLAQSNLSFESGTNPGGFTTVYAGQTNITGWSVDFGSVDYIGPYWQASHGNRSVDLNGQGQRGQISQEFATAAGWTYKVTFDMSGNPDGNPVSKFMSLSADKKNARGYVYVIGSNTRADMQWASNTYHFTAEYPATLLSFTSLVQGFYGPTLDNVSVTVETQVCHQNPLKTITVEDPADVAVHLAHGDTAGPCPE